jgi:hypothetical protein
MPDLMVTWGFAFLIGGVVVLAWRGRRTGSGSGDSGFIHGGDGSSSDCGPGDSGGCDGGGDGGGGD